MNAADRCLSAQKSYWIQIYPKKKEFQTKSLHILSDQSNHFVQPYYSFKQNAVGMVNPHYMDNGPQMLQILIINKDGDVWVQ